MVFNGIQAGTKYPQKYPQQITKDFHRRESGRDILCITMIVKHLVMVPGGGVEPP